MRNEQEVHVSGNKWIENFTIHRTSFSIIYDRGMTRAFGSQHYKYYCMYISCDEGGIYSCSFHTDQLSYSKEVVLYVRIYAYNLHVLHIVLSSSG